MKRQERARAPAQSPSSPLPVSVEVGDAALARQVMATGARLGVEVRFARGARALHLDQASTIAHTLRVGALSEVLGTLTLAPGASSRARRYLEPHVQAGPPTGRLGATLREEDDGRVVLVIRDRLPIDLGEPSEANAALREAQASRAGTGTDGDIVLPPGAEERARAIVFGPSRTLSEPSSRRVLEAFGIPGGTWRLSENAARAVIHARAVGYPVDLRLASPDASAIEEALLSATSLRSPNEVREGYRAIVREARRLSPKARVLGVTVMRHVPTLPRLRLTLDQGGAPGHGGERQPSGASSSARRLRVELDDPIGRKLTRPLTVVAPADAATAASALSRFEGREVLPEPDSPRGRALVDLLVRLSRIGLVLADALVRAEIAPLAPTTDGDGWISLGARLLVRGVDMPP